MKCVEIFENLSLFQFVIFLIYKALNEEYLRLQNYFLSEYLSVFKFATASNLNRQHFQKGGCGEFSHITTD